MSNISVTLTEEQALYVQALLSVESAKIGCRAQEEMLVVLAPGTTEDDRKAAVKPYLDRASAVYAIETAFSAGWPKPAS